MSLRLLPQSQRLSNVLLAVEEGSLYQQGKMSLDPTLLVITSAARPAYETGKYPFL